MRFNRQTSINKQAKRRVDGAVVYRVRGNVLRLSFVEIPQPFPDKPSDHDRTPVIHGNRMQPLVSVLSCVPCLSISAYSSISAAENFCHLKPRSSKFFFFTCRKKLSLLRLGVISFSASNNKYLVAMLDSITHCYFFPSVYHTNSFPIAMKGKHIFFFFRRLLS